LGDTTWEVRTTVAKCTVRDMGRDGVKHLVVVLQDVKKPTEQILLEATGKTQPLRYKPLLKVGTTVRLSGSDNVLKQVSDRQLAKNKRIEKVGHRFSIQLGSSDTPLLDQCEHCLGRQAVVHLVCQETLANSSTTSRSTAPAAKPSKSAKKARASVNSDTDSFSQDRSSLTQLSRMTVQ
jgi:hypothetical protein